MGRRRILRDKVEPPGIELDSHLSDSEIFDAAMADVRKIEPAKRRCRGEPKAPVLTPDPDPASEQSEFLKSQRIEIHHHPDYVEGGVGSWDRRLLRRLRRGDFSIQENLDLHGLTQAEAREELGPLPARGGSTGALLRPGHPRQREEFAPRSCHP